MHLPKQFVFSFKKYDIIHISSNEYFNLASIAIWFLVAINNEY